MGLLQQDGGLGMSLGEDLLATALGVVGHGAAVGMGVGDVLVGGLLGLGQDADGLTVRVLVAAPQRHQPGAVRRGERVPTDRGGQGRHPGDPRRPRFSQSGSSRIHRPGRRRAQGQGGYGPGPVSGVVPRLASALAPGPGPGPAAQPVYLALKRVPFLQQQGQLCFHLAAEVPYIVFVETTVAQAGQAEGHRPDAAGREPGPVRQA